MSGGRLTDLQAVWIQVHGGLIALREHAPPRVWHALVAQLHIWAAAELRRLESTREGRKVGSVTAALTLVRQRVAHGQLGDNSGGI